MKKKVFGILSSLSLQFFLGMVINMFAVAPDDPKYATESPLVKLSFIIHGINGLVLPIFALVILYFAVKSKKQELKKAAIYGLISILIAAGGGISTLILKDNLSELSSLVMATGFLLSYVSYFRFYYLIKE